MRGLSVILLAIVLPSFSAEGQTRRRLLRRPPPVVEPKRQPAEVKCPSALGVGIRTRQLYCDVLTGRDPAEGILVQVPPHQGQATLSFDLHNRHTYSEEQVRANRAYTRYTATMGVLTMDNTLLARGVVQSEFRNASDLVDRVGGGAGPGGMKAVAPTGTEPIAIEISEEVEQVSLLGEKLAVLRLDGAATYSSPGRPIAVVSNVQIEYRPAPVKPRKTVNSEI